VFFPQFDPARVSQANGSEDRGRQIPGPHHPPAYKTCAFGQRIGVTGSADLDQALTMYKNSDR
jgi:hypothetical protein